jgi:copper-binding protein NosD
MDRRGLRQARARAGAVLAAILVLGVAGPASAKPGLAGAAPAAHEVRAPRSSCPRAGVTVKPTQDLAAVVNASSQGTTFCLDPGTFRVQKSIGVKSGDVFIGSGIGKTVVRGDLAIPANHWSKTSGLWKDSANDALAQPLLDTKRCAVGGKVCDYQDDLNRTNTGVALKRVLSPCSSTKIVAGTYCIDYGKRTIYMRDDPSTFGGVTYTRAPAGFMQASKSSFSDMSILHVASTGLTIGTDSTATRVEVAFAHNAGVILSSNTATQPATVTRSRLHHNGLKGGGGTTASGVFTNNEVDHNGWAGYDGPEGVSGAKFSAADHLTVTDNDFHDNTGNGLWMDVQTENVTVTGNVMARNHITLNKEDALRGGHGIQIEHSCHIVLQNNTISNNDRSGINSTNPWDVAISGNTISGNGRGIYFVDNDGSQRSGACIPGGGDIVMRNVVISNNDITMAVGSSGFNAQGVPLNKTNSFKSNTYHVSRCSDPWWTLGATPKTLLSWSNWKAAGQDTSGDCGP